MRKFNHVGIPTNEKQENEIALDAIKCHITDFSKSPNRIEWLRFEEGSTFPKLIQTTAHIAYEVENMEKELANAEIIVEPFDNGEGTMIAFIVEEGAPIELMQFKA
ncbi:VOC family protein [Aureibacter tunicatorum]|uniref:Uncharacterized protein n=1 Tax=Aureibacter tunicatorum TaxID=866807 RepID=A0AAE4BV69_9BACT|nr:hypothetical protein [Aureibacter tunicatorum]MDR6241780.1 hypothetical protein [Aureibacter tunicatorum]